MNDNERKAMLERISNMKVGDLIDRLIEIEEERNGVSEEEREG